MLIDWLIYGLATWALVVLLNATAFKEQPASRTTAWVLTIILFFVNLVAMTALQYLRYEVISDNLGFKVKPGSPLDVIGAVTFSWLFFSLLRKHRKPAKTLQEHASSVPEAPVSRRAAANIASVPSSAPVPQALLESRSAAPAQPSADPALMTSRVPPEEIWAAALAEFESNARRPGLWARTFSESQGNEAAAKAAYLRQRAHEIQTEHEAKVVAAEGATAEAEKRRVAADAESRRVAEEAERRRLEDSYAALPKGKCPNIRCGAIIPLKTQACPKCGAIFEEGAAWKVLPIRTT